MPSFAFTARDTIGRSQVGTIDDATPSAAVDQLRRRGWLVLDVRDAAGAEEGRSSLAALDPREWMRARSVDVELGLRQMAVMLRSGLTLLDALTSVAEHAERRTMGRIWRQVADEIQQGASLGDAMGRHPRFSLLVVELVRVGSQTGQLEPVLTKAAISLEQRRHLRTSLLTALTYPTIVLLAAIGVTGFMALNVIPKLEKFLATIGRQLPPITRLLLDITHAIQNYFPHAVVVIIEPAIIVVVGGIVGFVYIAFFMALFAAGGAAR